MEDNEARKIRQEQLHWDGYDPRKAALARARLKLRAQAKRTNWRPDQ